MASSFDTTLANLGINRTTARTVVRSAAQADTLTQNDFLKLLTAQLRNQDPTSPVDATQQLTQLAQFSSVAGISEINTTLKAIQDKLAGTSTSDALSYVGRTVLVPGDTAFPRASGGLAGAVELTDDASNVNVSIQGPNGQILRSLTLGPQNKGTVSFDWDGVTDTGAPAGPGPFRVVASASKAGGSVPSTTLVWSPVTSVSAPSGGAPVLSLPGIGQIPISQVRQIG